MTTSEEADSGTDSNVTLTVYGDAGNTGPISLGSPSVGYFYSGKTDEFDVRILDCLIFNIYLRVAVYV